MVCNIIYLPFVLYAIISGKIIDIILLMITKNDAFEHNVLIYLIWKFLA